jgi:hypothetical protein
VRGGRVNTYLAIPIGPGWAVEWSIDGTVQAVLAPICGEQAQAAYVAFELSLDEWSRRAEGEKR